MRETDEIPRRRVLDAKLFLLQFLYSATAPAPQAHRIADYLSSPLEAQFALKEGLGLTVVLEDAAVSIFLQVEASMPQKGVPLVAGLVPGDAKNLWWLREKQRRNSEYQSAGLRR